MLAAMQAQQPAGPGMIGPGGPPVPGSDPIIPPAPEYGQSIGQMAGSDPMQQVPMGLMDVLPPPSPNMEGADPVLAQMLQDPPPVEDDEYVMWDIPRPDMSLVRAVAQADQIRYQSRQSRINRDISLYRQHQSAVPHGFDRRSDIPFVSPSLSNLVNKLANMLASPEPRFIVPFTDEPSKRSSQVMENFGYWCRRYAKKAYSRSGGGNLQWDEMFYLLLHGMLVARITPDLGNTKYPFHFSLLDPSTCFPTFAGDAMGLERMVRVYTSTVGEVLGTYGQYDKSLRNKLIDRMGYEGKSVSEYYWQEGTVVEYWDRKYRAVLWSDMEIMPVTKHGLDGVPFVCVVAKGEPKGMVTPLDNVGYAVDEFGNTGYGSGRELDLGEKATSVFHHLVNTNRLIEIVHTLSLIEVEKAIDPPTITYVAPQYQGQESEPLKTRKRGNNQRILNYQKVEAVPTSPRPTDMAPVMNKVMQDMAEGSLPPVMHGNESGSNVSGFAVESLIAAAKDVILPYTLAFEAYLAQVVEMKLRQYKKIILPSGTSLMIPPRTTYGNSPMQALTPEILDGTAIDVEVRLFALAQQNLPGQINAAAMAIQAGLWPIRKGMEHIGSTDPDQDFQDIISERALQHPEIMENFLIPQGFINQGSPELAQLWLQLVVLPKMQQAMMMGMAPPGAAGVLGPGSGGSGPEPNGQSNPMMGEPAPPPGGPGPGQGRGPAPQ
jgi:hypothetical protein